MNELKPCPFCGGEPKLMVCDGSGSYYANIGTAAFFGREMTYKLIRCQKCGIRTKAYLTEKGLFKAWNRRAGNAD